MKKFFVVVVVLLFSATTTFADEKEQVHKICSHFSEEGGKIMEARQQGIPMAPVIDVIRDEYGWDQDTLNVFERMVQEAYSVSISEDPSEVQRIISEYQSGVYERCRMSLENELNLYEED